MAKKRKEGEDTFIRITNKDIWEKLNDLKKLQQEHKEESTKKLNEMLNKQDLTNGKVMLHRKWLIGLTSTGLALFVTLIGFIIENRSIV